MISRLIRPTGDRMIGGVCSGLGLYFSLDPVIVRLLFVVLAFTTGLTLILYPILWAIMPSATPVPTLPPGARYDPQTGLPLVDDAAATGQTTRLPSDQQAVPPGAPLHGRNRILALVLVGVGALSLISNLGHVFGIDLASYALPLLLVGLGIYLLRGAHV